MAVCWLVKIFPYPEVLLSNCDFQLLLPTNILKTSLREDLKRFAVETGVQI
jgi:hypothetical protein